MRNTLVVAGVVLVAVAGGVYFFLYGPDSLSMALPSVTMNSGPQAVAVPFTELAHGTQSTVSTRANYLITSAGQLSQLWRMTDSTGETPTVDFTKDDVIAIFAGNEPTAGYTIAVSKIEDSQTRMITVLITKPGGSCALAQSGTSPYQVVELPKTTLSLSHKDTVTTISCLQ